MRKVRRTAVAWVGLIISTRALCYLGVSKNWMGSIPFYFFRCENSFQFWFQLIISSSWNVPHHACRITGRHVANVMYYIHLPGPLKAAVWDALGQRPVTVVVHSWHKKGRASSWGQIRSGWRSQRRRLPPHSIQRHAGKLGTGISPHSFGS